MKLLADECCDAGLVAALRASGHDVRYVAEEQPGLTDEEVLRTAFDERRVLLTEDKDFGDLVVRFERPTIGIVLIRLGAGKSHRKWKRVLGVLSAHESRLLDHYVVIHEDRVRFRPLSRTR